MTTPTVARPNDGWVLVATILASSMAFLDQSAVNVILAVVQHELQASAAQLLWFVNGYLLMLASLILVRGACPCNLPGGGACLRRPTGADLGAA